jgi:hypothetical protein
MVETSAMADPAPRVVEIASPSVRRETAGVAKAFVHIGMWTALVVSAQTNPARHASGSPTVEPAVPAFVRRFGDLDGKDQRTFRALQEGLGEAERRRSSNGAWPTAAELAADGIPPFAPDPIDKDGYAWSSFAGEGLVNYVGKPAPGSGRPTFVIVAAEPAKGSIPDPSIPLDEVHHRLASGLSIHVGVFMGVGQDEPKSAVPSVPFERGWQQILSGPTSVLGR